MRPGNIDMSPKPFAPLTEYPGCAKYPGCVILDAPVSIVSEPTAPLRDTLHNSHEMQTLTRQSEGVDRMSRWTIDYCGSKGH